MRNNSWMKWALSITGGVLLLALSGAGWVFKMTASTLETVRVTQAARGERITRLEVENQAIIHRLEKLEFDLYLLRGEKK